jgi:hypothetical protein
LRFSERRSRTLGPDSHKRRGRACRPRAQTLYRPNSLKTENSILYTTKEGVSNIKNATSAAVITSSGTGTITLDHSELTNNGTAVNASASGSTIRMNDVSMYDNTTGIAIGAGATVASANNNHSLGNTTSTGPNGTVNTF